MFEVTSDDVPGDGTHQISAVAYANDGVSGQDVEDLVIDVNGSAVAEHFETQQAATSGDPADIH